MNKAELITQIAMDADITKTAAGKALDSVMDNISRTIRKGDSVTLVGFGTFSATTRNAREGRNPRTGAPSMIPKHRAPHFKPSKTLKAKLN